MNCANQAYQYDFMVDNDNKQDDDGRVSQAFAEKIRIFYDSKFDSKQLLLRIKEFIPHITRHRQL